jgi:hypothetical protein
MICPPVEAAASTAPENAGLKPDFLITGMVITPVETTLEIAAPDSVPNSAELATAACAAPPVSPPVNRLAIFISRSPAPDPIRMAPKTMKISTLPVTTWTGWPNMPPVWAQKLSTIVRRFCAIVASDPARMPVHSGSQPRAKK